MQSDFLAYLQKFQHPSSRNAWKHEPRAIVGNEGVMLTSDDDPIEREHTKQSLVTGHRSQEQKGKDIIVD